MPSRRSRLLKAAVILAGCLFTVLGLGMIAVVAGGVKDSEVLVVTLYTLFTCLAALSSAVALRFEHLAPLVTVFATAAGTSAYLLEGDFRTEGAAGAAFALVTIPLLAGVFVAIAWTRSRRRPAAPEARARRA